MKNVAVLTEDREFVLFSRPHPREFDSTKVPTPGNLPSKNANARGSAGGGGGGGAGRRWNWLMHMYTDMYLFVSNIIVTSDYI